MKKFNSKQKKIKKDPIAPVLKNLELYKTVEFPLGRMTTVRATIQYISTEKGIAFITKKNKENKVLEVTRIA
jgi:carbamate kinase